MINLDERFHDYLGGRKTFKIDGVDEPLKGYGYNCDGNDIVGYYVTTTNYKLCLLYTSPSPRDGLLSRMPSSA